MCDYEYRSLGRLNKKCELSKYGIITRKGKKYCIFHAPSSIKFPKKFSKSLDNLIEDFIKSNSKEWDFEGFIFPDTEGIFSNNDFPEDVKINFSYANFENKVDFHGTEFFSKVNFLSAKFHKDVLFKKAEFNDDVSFDGVEFLGNVDFSGSAFSNKVSFASVHFYKDAYFTEAVFSDKTDFRDAEFSSETCFNESNFEDIAIFNGTIFSSKVIFSNTSFARKCIFSNSKFSHIAEFINVYFKDSTSFRGVEFSGVSNFSGSKFSKVAEFVDAKFISQGFFKRVSFLEGVLFSRANLSNVDFSYTDLSFPKTSFEDANLEGASFNGANLTNACIAITSTKQPSKYLDFSYKLLPNIWLVFFRIIMWFLLIFLTPIIFPSLLIDKIRKKYLSYIQLDPIRGATIFKDVRITSETENAAPELVSDIRFQQNLFNMKSRSPFLYRLWGISSLWGERISLWLFWCVFVITIFGFIFMGATVPDWIPSSISDFLCSLHPKIFLKDSSIPGGWFDNFYLSGLVFTSLGVADFVAVNTSAKIFVLIEVLLGFIMLGSLVSFFVNKFIARR